MLQILLLINNLYLRINPILLQIPGGKLVTDGLGDIAKSDSLLINKILIILFILFGMFAFCAFKYVIKKHKEELMLQNEKNKEENAINVGAQQLVIKGKDEVIATISKENIYLKEKSEELKDNMVMVLRDNIEASKQLVAKIGQHSDISVSILSTINTNHENMKLFISEKIMKTN